METATTSGMDTLDNPVWTALRSGNRQLNQGNQQVLFFPELVSPFAALERYEAGGLYALHELLPAHRTVALLTTAPLAIPAYWEVVEQMEVIQLVCTERHPDDAKAPQAVPLTDAHVPEMLALTALTHPGPFLPDTIQLGGYQGFFEAGKLVAMAGYRMAAGQSREISAVCTHPAYSGKGYASRLVQQLKNQNFAESRFSFLHVKGDNRAVVKFYEKLGFTQRIVLHLSVLKKTSLAPKQ